MGPLAERLLRTIEREALVPRDGRVLVALSGGADSVALTALLHEISPRGAFLIAGLLHVNHQLRGAAAETDEKFCRELARNFSLPVRVERVDVAAQARADGISVEDAGHRERYAIFERVAAELNADCVATAHTRDDQAETFLLRMIRGAGPGGLAGIWPRAGRIIRPLLGVARAELRDYLAGRGLSFREDNTNWDLRVTRNRVRHRLLPFLEANFSPSIVGVLAREATIARGDAEWLEWEANNVARDLVSYGKGTVTVDADRLRRQPIALARRIAKQVLERASGRAIGFDHVERLLQLAGIPGTRVTEADFPGSRVERRGSQIVVTPPRPRRRSKFDADRFECQLTIPGEVVVEEAGVTISAERASQTAWSPTDLMARGTTVTVAEAHLSAPLTVRSWRPGDTFRPLGLGGHKKLQDFFVDRKVAREQRSTVPIVTDSRLGIVWVVGHAVADDFRVTERTRGVILLKARQLGGMG